MYIYANRKDVKLKLFVDSLNGNWLDNVIDYALGNRYKMY